jgi:hypothetical protein
MNENPLNSENPEKKEEGGSHSLLEDILHASHKREDTTTSSSHGVEQSPQSQKNESNKELPPPLIRKESMNFATFLKLVGSLLFVSVIFL